MERKAIYEGIIAAAEDLQGGLNGLLFSSSQRAAAATFSSAVSAAWYRNFKAPYRIAIVGLGDVGLTVAAGFRLAASPAIAEIGLYDIDEQRLAACEMEISQINSLDFNATPVVIKDDDSLFDCDVIVFTASKGVPALDSGVNDVRLYQLEQNAEIVKHYIARAIKARFGGLFCVMSDPVDLLCKVALDYAQLLDFENWHALRVRGFGLGVMYARAQYYAKKLGVVNFLEKGRVYGPHGADLIAINDCGAGFDYELSQKLSKLAVEANLAVRKSGRKPYVAPALSSGALSIVALLEGRWQHSAIAFDDVFLGIRNRMTARGIELDRIAYNPTIASWIERTIASLERQYEALHSK